MSHAQVHVVVHFVWATRRRASLLPPSLDVPLTALLGALAREAGCALLIAGVASDHVHALVRVGKTTSLAALAQRMKGASAHALNLQAPCISPVRWQNGYWAESVSPSDLEPLVRYLRQQRAYHDDSHPTELWQLGSP